MTEIRPNRHGVFPCVIEKASWGEHIICQVALGNMTQYRILVAPTSHGVFIAIENVGAYEFGGFAHYGYVMDKLKLKHGGDACNIADFINDQLQNKSERQGMYQQNLCKEFA